ncbi:ATP-dependent DNA helicase [Aeromicrobium sp. 179-A 4D2 NHS]|uniref:ATP-dependent DNA helicase n=1 Tax=Aeromicrobium sp. 179-A 4D2 NHS TaxID=3142375 RepID=UPI0039A36650
MTTTDPAYKILRRTAELLTGRTDIEDRPGQVGLSNQIAGCMAGLSGPVVGEAGTGVGKSFAYLAPAAYAASLGERTVISTESLALQTQIVEKDAPRVAEACEQVTGYRPKTAVLKGFSNYACSRAAVEQAEQILGDHDVAGNRQRAIKDPYGHVKTLASRLASKPDNVNHPETSLVRWALLESVNDATGDKFAFDGKMDHETWGTVSISSSECVGVEKCPFADMCLPRKSRTVAAEADIVVTNHTMLGVQASKGVPVVIGSKTLGEFHNIVVDEAHGLPGVVRNQGASYVSGLRFYQTANALKNVFDPHDPATQAYIDEAGVVGDMVDAALSEWSQNLEEGQVARLGDGDNPLKSVVPRAKRWIKAVKENLETVADNPSANEIAIRRLIARVDDLSSSMKNCDDHEPGTARWIEIEDRGPRPWTVVRYTPVDVSAALNFNVWTCPDLEAEEEDAGPSTPDIHFDDEDGEAGDESGEKANPYANRRHLNVACVSATLPVSFCRDVGLRTQTAKFESPFAKAFSQSVLFVPRADDPADIAALAGETANQSRPKFNTRMHQAWAANIMAQLIDANRGSALVLSATAGSGRKYAEHLRAKSGGRYKVISQWDGLTIRQATDEWKRDPSSVLVGTRSLMTGVDAPGETNSLVIVDRIPRAASNPVDDARCEKLMNDADFDKWAADRLVYGGDAALLLEQAGGRLIRSADDSGMVAVLDPRLLKIGKMLYPAPTRDLYLGALAHFPNKMSNLDKACAWLERRSERMGTAA